MKSYMVDFIRGCFYLVAGLLMLIAAIVLPMGAGCALIAVCGGLVMAGGIYFLMLYSQKRYAEEQNNQTKK